MAVLLYLKNDFSESGGDKDKKINLSYSNINNNNKKRFKIEFYESNFHSWSCWVLGIQVTLSIKSKKTHIIFHSIKMKKITLAKFCFLEIHIS